MSKQTPNTPQVYEPFVVLKEDKERAIRFFRLLDDMKDLTGKVLTIVDASIVNEQQNKAMKDLIRAQFTKTIGRYEDICFYGKQQKKILYFTE